MAELLAVLAATWVAIVVTQYQYYIKSTEIFPLYNASAVIDTASEYYTFITLVIPSPIPSFQPKTRYKRGIHPGLPRFF